MADLSSLNMTVTSSFLKSVSDTGGVCPPWRFTCQSGECISPSQVCDGNPDCLDGSDETSQYANCSSSSSINYEGSISVATGIVALALVATIGIYCYKYGKPRERNTLGEDVAETGEATVCATAYHNHAFTSDAGRSRVPNPRRVALDSYVPAMLAPALQSSDGRHEPPPSYNSIFGATEPVQRQHGCENEDTSSETDIFPQWSTDSAHSEIDLRYDENETGSIITVTSCSSASSFGNSSVGAGEYFININMDQSESFVGERCQTTVSSSCHSDSQSSSQEDLTILGGNSIESNEVISYPTSDLNKATLEASSSLELPILRALENVRAAFSFLDNDSESLDSVNVNMPSSGAFGSNLFSHEHETNTTCTDCSSSYL